MKELKELKEFLARAALGFEQVDLVRSRFKRGEAVRSLADAVRAALAGMPQPAGPEAEALVRGWLAGQLKGKTVSETVLRAAWSAALTAVRSPARPRLIEVKPGKELDALWADAEAAAVQKRERLQAGRKKARRG